jgi:hypothetical protein
MAAGFVGRFKQQNTCGSAGLECLTALSDERDNSRLGAIGIFQVKRTSSIFYGN